MAELIKRQRSRLVLFAAVLGLVVPFALILPSTDAEAAHEGSGNEAGIILLSTGPNPDDNWVRYYADPAAPLDVGAVTPDAEQTILVDTKCKVTTSGDQLLSITASDGDDVGMVDNGMGERNKNNCSSQQGRIGPSQSLTFALGAFFTEDEALEDVRIGLAEVGVEGKFGASVGYSLDGGDLEEPIALPLTDNGPDSGVNDDNIAIIDSTTGFSSITFEAAGPSNAQIAIQGASDGDLPGDPGTARDTFGVNQTLFQLVRVLDCGDTIELSAQLGLGWADSAVVGRGDNLKGQPCAAVSFSFEIQDDRVLFDADIDDQENANFLIRIDWNPNDPVVDPFNPPDRKINYLLPGGDPEDFDPIEKCVALADEGTVVNLNPDIDDIYEHPLGPTGDDLVKKFDGEIVPWCLAGEQLVLLESGQWQQIQWYDGASDPHWK